jgi:hemoglobin-like flavoprotein
MMTLAIFFSPFHPTRAAGMILFPCQPCQRVMLITAQDRRQGYRAAAFHSSIRRSEMTDASLTAVMMTREPVPTRKDAPVGPPPDGGSGTPTARQVELVQSSFAKVVPIAAVAAELFYGRLFEIAPEVKPLFRHDMREQGRKLMTTLGVVVGSLKHLDAIMPAVKALAVKHVGYGVVPAHYAQVGAALLWTLEKGLGDAFTPEVRDAWATTYTALSGVMMAEAYGKKAAA